MPAAGKSAATPSPYEGLKQISLGSFLGAIENFVEVTYSLTQEESIAFAVPGVAGAQLYGINTAHHCVYDVKDLARMRFTRKNNPREEQQRSTLKKMNNRAPNHIQELLPRYCKHCKKQMHPIMQLAAAYLFSDYVIFVLPIHRKTCTHHYFAYQRILTDYSLLYFGLLKTPADYRTFLKMIRNNELHIHLEKDQERFAELEVTLAKNVYAKTPRTAG